MLQKWQFSVTGFPSAMSDFSSFAPIAISAFVTRSLEQSHANSTGICSVTCMPREPITVSSMLSGEPPASSISVTDGAAVQFFSSSEMTLSGQSGPVFVFCANDRCASNVLSACKSAGVRVPAEVAVIGVDNDTLLCNHSDPTLTSIEPDFEREGYEAAKELDRLLSGPGKPPHRIPLVSGSSVVVRASTRPVYSAEAIVQAGMDFIRGNFAKGITVTSVVRAMRVSRRLAELRFRQVRGTTIGASIAKARIRHAQKLLKTTQMSLDEIAADCGISGANYLVRVFRRHVGLSPRAWARARG